MNTKMIAIIAVVLIVGAGGAYYLLKQNSDSSFAVSDYPDSYLTVLGNANLDLEISVADATKIQELIDSAESYSYRDYYMYDANFDKKIDSADVDKVNAMVASLASGDWSAVGKVWYVNVDRDIVSYDMTQDAKLITLIAPPLDSVLAMGGKDKVVGFDDRITTGKYRIEYNDTFDIDGMYNVGSCNEPSTEVITQAYSEKGPITVVCGTKGSYGPTMESTFSDIPGIQVIRIASWEYGGTLYGFMTLGFLLKLNAGAKAYYDKYQECNDHVKAIVASVPAATKEANGAAAAYAYGEELQLLGRSSGEYANLMVLEPYDTTEAYLHGRDSGSHGDVISNEAVSAMHQQYKLSSMILMVGTPFQIISGGQAVSSQMESIYEKFAGPTGFDAGTLGINACVVGYSFSSGVSEVLNRLILSYYLYNDEFLAHFGCADQDAAKAKIGEYVDWYCEAIGIDGLWSFSGGAGTYGMNLLYCPQHPERSIMNGASDYVTPSW